MRSCDENRSDKAPRFRPALVGCVAKDLALCRILCGMWADTLSSFRCNLEGSLFLLPTDRDSGEALYRDAMEMAEELRNLGELIVALGGRTLAETVGGRKHRCRTGEDYFTFAVKDKMRRVDLYETLMSRTGDRVVRSVIAGLISSQRKSVRSLEAAFRTEHSPN